jgi:hypothetical protein
MEPTSTTYRRLVARVGPFDFDPDTDRLVAYGRITVWGLGQTGDRIERRGD